KYGFVDEEGKFIIQPKYKQATVFSEGLAWVVEENGAPIAINKKGETKITLKNAEEVGIFKEGLAFYSAFNKDGKKEFGFIDNTGNIVIKPKFSTVGFFTEGLCAVKNELGKIGYINKKGELIVNYQFDKAG
ncbi:WG repeat-containing protein, partial [Parazoarcus communis]|uniref:WG repeat-containing protein n=1 Tax=Parazoarcus communis TaxID=41977 RepID=UPI001459BE2B